MALQALQRLGSAAVDAESGSGCAGRRRSDPSIAAPRSAQHWRARAVRPKKSSGLRNRVSGGEDRPFAIVLEEAVALARVVPEALESCVDLAVQHQHRLGAEVVEDRRRGVEEERQVVLDAGGGDAGADVLVDAHLGRIAFDLLAPACPERGARVLVHRELAARQQAHFGHRVEAALAVGVEGPDRVDLVAEEVDAVGHGRTHREQVDQSAAHRVLAGRDDLADVRVAGQRELRLQAGLVELFLVLKWNV